MCICFFYCSNFTNEEIEVSERSNNMPKISKILSYGVETQTHTVKPQCHFLLTVNPLPLNGHNIVFYRHQQ